MPSYTTSLRLIQPATGEYSGTWGTQVNNGITALVDTSVAGTATITMTAADYTLSTANGATDEARAMFLVLGGTPGAARNVICPAVSKLYYVTNNTTGGFAQTVKTASGSGISVPNGASMVLRCDGTNVVEAQNSLGSIILNGGTANGVAYLNASKVVTTGSALVFDGTNLGIGTSSPNTKLDVAGKAKIDVNTYASGYALTFGAISETARTYQMGMVSGSAFAIYDSTAAAQRVVLDSSGNLGIGTSSPGARLHVKSNGQTAIFEGTTARGSGNIYASFNDPTGRKGYWGYGASNDDFEIANELNGGLRIYTNNTERARITSGGDLLVGTTSVNGKLDVRGVTGSANNTATFANGTDNQSFDVLCGRALTNGTAGGVASSLVMTLRSSGASAGVLAFATGNDERARITAGGDFVVGTTTLAGAGGISLQSVTSGFALINNNNAGATGYVFESFRRSSTEIGSITQNGTTAVQFNTTSDRRLKDNIVPAPSASDVIDAIEIVSHDWKAAPDEHVAYGVIAQDLALVAPQAVLQGDDGDEIEKTWGVDYSKLVPMLIKEIQSLRARVATLEQA